MVPIPRKTITLSNLDKKKKKMATINTREQILAFSWKTLDTNKINLKEIRRYCDSRRTLQFVLFVFVLLFYGWPVWLH